MIKSEILSHAYFGINIFPDTVRAMKNYGFFIGKHAFQINFQPDVGYSYQRKGNASEIVLGIPVCPAAIAHEATHAAIDLLKLYHWSELVATQNARYKKEEAMCLLIQHITYKSLEMAIQAGVQIKHRPPKGTVL
jgi:hypothetical protein